MELKSIYKKLEEQFKGFFNQNETIPLLDDLARSYKSVFSTSFGKEDQIITYMIVKNSLPIEIFTLDTGRLFNETYSLHRKTNDMYRIKIKTYFPDSAELESLINEKGPDSFFDSVENRKECCAIRKVNPLKRALKGNSIWVTGIRKAQSPERSNLPMLEMDETHGLIKVHPLLNWSDADVDQYIKDNGIPYNVLHDKGYPSVGCMPCTRAIEPGEDLRAGRWWWETGHKECGLHVKK